MAAKIEVRHLTISFRTNNGAVRAVRDISFTLNEGETLAIAGESGSGKSVTTKAIMGISAPNAIVENGEIIYDGRDLLKIDEEDFHTLRGHKLSMVFQDPLSALNPVMRIGKQLTEAMILNNKERRRDGKKTYKAMTEQLYGSHATPEETALFKAFDANVAAATPERIAYDDARNATREMHMFIREMRDDLLKHADAKALQETAGRLTEALKNTQNPMLFSAEEIADFTAALTPAKEPETEKLMSGLDRLEAQADALLKKEAPDFYALAWCKAHQVSLPADPAAARSAAGTAFEEGLILPLKKVIAGRLKDSALASVEARKEALAVLEKEAGCFDPQMAESKAACLASAKRMAQAVEHAIDRLNLQKDNSSYVFASTVRTNIERYFHGLKQNPKEQARFSRDTVKYQESIAKGKDTPEVVPEFTVDLDVTRGNITGSIQGLVDAYRAAAWTETPGQLDRRAGEMITYLQTAWYDSAYTMPKWIAKNRAISLMKEVGIPEPYKRYHQYPFEFSGGMRQRIVIAIALSANPDVLICDEPTTALDVTIQAQILELINRLKAERHLTVIFITHDLGVVANMADKIAIMYAGKIVEYGTAEDVFYDPRHPYTWALLSSMPDLETKEKLEAIPGTPPDMIFPPKGDAFADRNRYALQIDFEQQPPQFEISPTHWAATWLLHPQAPHVDPPAIVTERIERMRRKNSLRQAAADQKGGAEA